MEFDAAISIITDVLDRTESSIRGKKYVGLIVKKMEASNTLEPGRTTNQSHIAITGDQMDFFPYICANRYFECDYSDEDMDLKKFFVAQIPVFLYKANIHYLCKDENIFSEDEHLVHVSIVRSRRKNALDQIQMSMVYLDSPEFISFRKMIHSGSYMIMLKREKKLEYEMYAIHSKRSSF